MGYEKEQAVLLGKFNFCKHARFIFANTEGLCVGDYKNLRGLYIGD